MRNGDSNKIPTSHPPTIPPSRFRVAFLWDESFLWGVMAYKALSAAGLRFELLRSEDVKKGRLKDHAMLFVPGGWASNKLKALGEDGVREIKKFVHDGGAYLGFCGGAGLATQDGIGLVPVRRKPTTERVPSFNGRIRLDVSDHPLWDGITEPVFHAWWPSQFVIEGGSVTALATYGEALPDSFSSDVNVGDAAANGKWPELERRYQINLDPGRLLRDPAVIEGAFGKGKVVLSLIHFDTPGDGNGAVVLKNLWTHLGCLSTDRGIPPAVVRTERPPAADCPVLQELETALSGLIDLGLGNFLWRWRNPLLLQWKRGVRGFEYCTLHIMIKELSGILGKRGARETGQGIEKKLQQIRALLLPFLDKAKRLLLLERCAMQNGPITYDTCDDPEIQALREELFSRSKSHGGLFKKLVDEIDGLLFTMILNEQRRRNDTA